MEIFLWFVSITLIALALVPIAFNFWIFVEGTIRRNHTPSVAPFVGGFVAAIGVCLLPIEGAYKFAWIPLVADFGGILWLIFGYFFDQL